MGEYWVDDAMESLDDHVLLKQINTGDNLHVFRMGIMGDDGLMQGMMGVDIMFSVSRIVISGDFCPRRNGVISDLGYGIGWFSKELSPDYLCSKFAIPDQWTGSQAMADLEDYLKDYSDETPEVAELEKVLADPGHWCWESGQVLYDYMSEHIQDYWDSPFGDGYDRRDYSVLTAINKTFARLYREH